MAPEQPIEQTPQETPQETPQPNQNLAALQQFLQQNQPIEGQEMDPQVAIAEEVFRLAVDREVTNATKQMQAVNKQMSDSQAEDIIAAMRANDYGRVAQVFEAATKQKLELQQENREQELKETETEGASRGQQVPQERPKNMQEAKNRALSRLRAG